MLTWSPTIRGPHGRRANCYGAARARFAATSSEWRWSHVDWPPEDSRWFWMLWRPVPGHEDYNAQQQAECCECFKLILARWRAASPRFGPRARNA